MRSLDDIVDVSPSAVLAAIGDVEREFDEGRRPFDEVRPASRGTTV